MFQTTNQIANYDNWGATRIKTRKHSHHPARVHSTATNEASICDHHPSHMALCGTTKYI